MAKISLLKTSKQDLGLWVSGGKELTPGGFFRRLKGTHSIGTNSVRSRNGSTRLYTISTVHSLTRFDDVRFQGAGDTLYRNGFGNPIKSGLTSPLRFLRMAPQAGGADYLFVVDGASTLFKVDSAGVVTDWGISPPANGFATASVNGPGGANSAVVPISPIGDWTTEGVGVTVAIEPVIQQGTTLRIDVPVDILGSATKSSISSINMEANFNDNTYTEFWIRADPTINIDLLQIQFDLEVAADFSKNFYTYVMRKEEGGLVGLFKGAASIISNLDDEADIVSPSGRFTIEAERVNASEAASTTTIQDAPGNWVKMRIPKTLYTRSGSASLTWSTVFAIRITIKANNRGEVKIYLAQVTVFRSGGLIGLYKYLMTYRNSVTGSRSNANSIAITELKRDQKSTLLSSLPVSPDAQVDKIEIWRSVGDGTRFFRSLVVNDTIGSVTEHVGDYPGIASPLVTASLENLELPTDNEKPFSTFKDTAGPHNAAAWWLNSASGTRGRVYFSPIGRPESVKGFINVSTDDDPTQRLVILGSSLFVLTEARLFQILGTDPYTSREVFGVPGTSNPGTVVETPIGIIYEARDGVTVFDGSRSSLIAFDSVGILFRGETAEGIPAFSGTVVAYGKGIYYISNGTTTLALDIRARTWRNLGVGADALFYEDDTGELIISFDGKVLIFEAEGVFTDDGATIPFELEPPSIITDVDHEGIFRFLFIEANTAGISITPTIIIDGVETTLPTFSTTSRTTTEFTIGKPGRVIGVRLEGSLNAQIEIFNIEVDIYVPSLAEASGRPAT